VAILGDSAIFANDAITRSQWNELHRSTELSPTRRLQFAVLEDALKCAGVIARRTYPPRPHRTVTASASAANRVRKVGIRQAEAIRWMLADDADGPFSFGSVCSELGIDAGRLRGLVAPTPPTIAAAIAIIATAVTGTTAANRARTGNP